MLQKYLTIFFIVFTTSAAAQNLRVLENFDRIPLSSQRFEVEGFMATFSGYKQEKVNDKWDPDKKYIAIEYVDSKDGKIILFFYEGVLYLKRLILSYSLEDLGLAKEEFENLKKYIVSTNTIVKKSEGIISNKAYGSQIGEGVTYSLTSSTKLYKRKSADFFGALDISYNYGKPTTAKIIGYNLKYECIDLSKTTLDAKT